MGFYEMKILGSIKTQKAMTLVEVMVSVGLIVILAGAVLVLLIQNMKMGATIDYNYAAINIAKSRIDRIRELRRDDGFSGLSATAETDTKVDRDGLPDSSGDFTRITTITTGFNNNSNLTKVEVKVSYKGPGDVSTTTVILTSLLSPYI